LKRIESREGRGFEMSGRGYGRGRSLDEGTGAISSEERKNDDGGAMGMEQEDVKKRSWLNIAAAAATLTLGVIRVIRDANDFYRKTKEGS
jgi:hypothetical protein